MAAHQGFGPGQVRGRVFLFGVRVAENPFVDWWTDKTILIPKGLLIEGVTGEELAVYAKMKSFGPQARASLKALSLRLGWDEKKVRKYQASLWEKGWLFLMTEGGNKKPRHWYLANKPGEQPTPEILAAATGGAMVPKQPFQGTQNGHPADFVPPTKSVPETDKGSQTNKTPESENATKEAKRVKGAAIGATIGAFKKLWELKYGETYQPKLNPQDGKAAEALVALNISTEEMLLKAEKFLQSKDEWICSKRHSFWVLKYKWNDFSSTSKPKRDMPAI